jgi:cyclopropane-fatty-acyl-phospholipid synthase
MDGDWDVDDLPRFLALVLDQSDSFGVEGPLARLGNLLNDVRHRLRANTRAGSRRNIRAHYDLSNELFATFLDETMTYSCAVFDDLGQPLADAQRNKYVRLARAVGLRGGDHVLEIGCGWGGFATWAAAHTGCRVTAATISESQYAFTRERVRAAGLAGRVEVVLADYRDLAGTYDRIVSIEMFEAVGFEHWPTFFASCERLLAPSGLVALQAITLPDHRFAAYRRRTDFLQRYIFPGGELGAVGGMAHAMAAAGTLGIHRLDDIGIHYAETLARWRHAFLAAVPQVRALGFDDRFVRMWDYYLASCQALFATRQVGTVQMVLTRPGNRALPAIPGRQAVAA